MAVKRAYWGGVGLKCFNLNAWQERCLRSGLRITCFPAA